MKLTVRERVVLGGMLPEAGDIVTVRAMVKCREALGLTEVERDMWGITVDGTTWTWKENGEAEVEISGRAFGVIGEALNAMNSAKTLTPNHVSLWEKFVESNV